MPRLNLKTKFITSYRIFHPYLRVGARKQFLMNIRYNFKLNFAHQWYSVETHETVLVTCILWVKWLTNMPSRPCFLEVYLISGLVLLLVILQWHLGTRWGDLWHHFLSPSPHPCACAQVVSVSVKALGRWGFAVPPARVLLVCVAAAVVQILLKTWAPSTVPGTGSNRKRPSAHLSPGPGGISFISSFFSPQTCSRGSAPWKAEV